MTICPKCKRPLAGPFVGGMGEPPVPRGACRSSFRDGLPDIRTDSCRDVEAAYRAGVLRGVEIARTAAKLEWHREDTAEIDWSDVDRAVREEVGE